MLQPVRPLPADDHRRVQVWHILADLFLDTELNAQDYATMGARLRATGHSPAALRWILEWEVAPALMLNLFSIAGEWAGWTESEVAAKVRRAGRRPDLIRRFGRWLMRRHTAAEWRQLAPWLEPTDSLSPPCRLL